MSRDEIRIIAEIVGGDRTYSHFVHRINKEFELSDEDRNSKVFVLFEEEGDKKIGFSVIGASPAKMRVWEKVFKEEGWYSGDFDPDNSYELMYMYIAPEYRGKGIGTRLFKKVTDFTKENKIKQIYAYVSDRNPKALSFYKKMKANILQDLSDEEITSAFLKWNLQ
jgi:ribosomal protein S18 acetylase RimI-like enzyme